MTTSSSMSDSHPPSTQSSDPEYIRNAGEAAKNGNYADALAIIKTAKAIHPRNIYLIALEVQIEKLIPSGEKTLTDAQRREIINFLPSLINRAIENVAREKPSLQHIQAAPGNEQQKDALKRRKELAVEKLKRQYFDQADEYVKQGNCENALAEIRRIHILDPSDRVATEYEEKITQLLELRGMESPPEPPPRPAVEQGNQLKPARPQRPEHELNEFMSPFLDVPPGFEFGEPYRAYETKRPPVLFIAAVVLIFAGAGVGYYFASTSASPETAQAADSPAEPFSESTEQMKKSFDGVSTVVPKEPEKEPHSKSASQVNVNNQKEAGSPAAAAVEQTSGPEADIKTHSDLSRASDGEPDQRSINTEQEMKTDNAQDTGETTVEPQPSGAAENTSEKAEERERAGTSAMSSTVDSKTEEEVSVVIEKIPQITRLETPVYPDSALQVGLSGQVIVRVQIDSQGKPLQAKVHKSSHQIFEVPALDAALKSQYAPGLSSTGPVTAWISVPFLFRK